MAQKEHKRTSSTWRNVFSSLKKKINDLQRTENVATQFFRIRLPFSIILALLSEPDFITSPKSVIWSGPDLLIAAGISSLKKKQERKNNKKHNANRSDTYLPSKIIDCVLVALPFASSFSTLRRNRVSNASDGIAVSVADRWILYISPLCAPMTASCKNHYQWKFIN